MGSSGKKRFVGSAGDAGCTVLEVVVLYEDLEAAMRAKRSLKLLPAQRRTQSGLRTQLWRLDLMREPLLREQAALEAADADLVLLSVHGGGELGRPTLDWLRCWVAHQPRRPCSIGLLLNAAAKSAPRNKVIARVQRFANAAGAKLFYSFSAAGDEARTPVEAAG
jgi:hypothetical protein